MHMVPATALRLFNPERTEKDPPATDTPNAMIVIDDHSFAVQIVIRTTLSLHYISVSVRKTKILRLGILSPSCESLHQGRCPVPNDWVPLSEAVIYLID